MTHLKIFQDAFVAMLITGKSLQKKIMWFDGAGDPIEIEFNDCPRNVIVRYYWPNGQLYVQKRYVNGVPEGTCNSYHPNGKKWFEIEFKRGKEKTVSKWNQCGSPEWCRLPIQNMWIVEKQK